MKIPNKFSAAVVVASLILPVEAGADNSNIKSPASTNQIDISDPNYILSIISNQSSI